MEHIVKAIRRVISEADNQSMEREASKDQLHSKYDDHPPLPVQSTPFENVGPPVVVEVDDQLDIDTRRMNEESDEMQRSMSASSSLSDEKDQHIDRDQKMQRNYSVDSSVASSIITRSSHNGSGNWGWFEDVHESSRYSKKVKNHNGTHSVPLPGNDASAMAVTAPTYVLEESLSSQKLWKESAGTRPPQPVEERAFYEKMWTQNFSKSQVNYGIPPEVLTATSPISLSPFENLSYGNELCSYDISEDSKQCSDPTEAALGRLQSQHKPAGIVVNKSVKGTESDPSLIVLIKGDNVFGTTVSKSFAVQPEKGGPLEVETINISVASYRVIESKKHGKYAQYLVIYREGGIRDTIGVWKRYSDFKRLSEKVTNSNGSCVSVLANMSPLAITEEHDVEHLPNAITSWSILKKRQRWYRCLDSGYLSLKVFLLERFLHDILFESSSPTLLREFVGVDASNN